MRKTTGYFLLVILLITLLSCTGIVKRSGLVGCWQDMNNPEMVLKVTWTGKLYYYQNGEMIASGRFDVLDDSKINFTYEAVEDGWSAILTDFTVTEDTLIIEDPFHDLRWYNENKRIDCP